MRTSHKHTHTQLPASRFGRFGISSSWFRLLVIALCLGGLAYVAGRHLGLRTAKANEMEAARAQLAQAKAAFLADPNNKNKNEFDEAMSTYKSALRATPVPQPTRTPYFTQAAGFAVSGRLSDAQPEPPSPNAVKVLKSKKGELNELPIHNRIPNPSQVNDPALQSALPPALSAVTAPIQNFPGIDMDSEVPIFGGRFAPPDTNADVGPNHVVLTVNSAIQVYSKTGVPLTPVAPLSVLFGALPPPCNTLATANDGDPIVLYDPLADRWIVTQFCTTPINGQTSQLIAVSTTADPTGSYYAYNFPVARQRFNDYPHLGVWPDAYYMSVNDFNFAGTQFLGASLYAFERAKLLVGDPTARLVGFSTDPTDGGFLPADLDGFTPPPAGAPGLFMEFLADEFGSPFDGLRIFEMRPNFANPPASTLTQLEDLPSAAFDARSPSTRAAIEQPPPATSADYLDAIADRLMHRLTYRILPGDVQSLVLNFTVNASGQNPTSAATYQAGTRWMELRRNATGLITINQQATYAPGAGNGATGRNLWMGSAAQDGEGNIGLGASASSTALIPTAIYTGRLVEDPINTLPQGEVDALVAVPRGVQIGTGNRWGDYSSMSVDPSDECTFWGAFEYVDPPSGNFDWNTRIFSFKVDPGCVTPAMGFINATVTNASAGGAPLAGATGTTPTGYFRQTGAAGTFSLKVAPGTQVITITRPGFSSCTQTVTIPPAGGTVNISCALLAAPVLVAGAAAITAEDCETDGRTDPGEVVTVNLCVTNSGGLAATNLVGTLQTSGGVTLPSGAVSFGAVAAGATVCRPFTFTVNPNLTCGSNVVATLALQDGALNLGTVSYTFGSGDPTVSFTENFDSVVAPALPAGWTTATNGAPLPPWVTSTITPDTPPNALFAPDVPGDGTFGRVNEVVSPPILISGGNAQLRFRNLFNLEQGFDGGVLEIKIGGAAFTDIILAGGSFVSGGYTGFINTDFANPLAARDAWTGLSAGTTAAPAYITTLVNLPPTANGQVVQFRWRLGVDDSFVAPGVAGWRIDSVQVTGTSECCRKVTPTLTLTDPLACTGPGNLVTGAAVITNPFPTPRTGTVTIALPVSGAGDPLGAGRPLLLAIGCTASTGSCAPAGPSTLAFTGTLPAGGTVTINYQVQVGDVAPATPLCVTVSGAFPNLTVVPTQACLTVNCPAAGPGLLIPTTLPGGGAAPLSDQKPGSVLIYPVYTSGSSDIIKQNTRISITNTHTVLSAQVHLFFIEGATCSVADAFICLTPNQTSTFLASDLDPGTTGYIVAMAVNQAGCPTSFNYLIGDEYVKFSSGHFGNLGAESVPAVAGGSTFCTGSTAVVRFDGVAYAPLPRVVALDNIPSRADGNDTLLVLDRIGGDLLTTAATLTNLFGILYNDMEVGLSFSFGSGSSPGVCQFRSSLSNTFPRTTPRFEQFIPAGRSGWLKMYSTSDQAIIGSSFNFNPNSTASAGAFNGAHNLHKLTLTTAASYTVPVLPVSCQ